jgi:hypothetical protein
MNPTYNNDNSGGKGARIGIDFYIYTYHWVNFGGANIIGYAFANGSAIGDLPLAEAAYSTVAWNTGEWTKQTMNITIPVGYGIGAIIPWMQATDAGDTAIAWFASAEVYINPSESEPTPTPTPSSTPTATPTSTPTSTTTPPEAATLFLSGNSIPFIVPGEVAMGLGIVLALGCGAMFVYIEISKLNSGGKK